MSETTANELSHKFYQMMAPNEPPWHVLRRAAMLIGDEQLVYLDGTATANGDFTTSGFIVVFTPRTVVTATWDHSPEETNTSRSAATAKAAMWSRDHLRGLTIANEAEAEADNPDSAWRQNDGTTWPLYAHITLSYDSPGGELRLPVTSHPTSDLLLTLRQLAPSLVSDLGRTGTRQAGVSDGSE
jgi:hypothetical protein